MLLITRSFLIRNWSFMKKSSIQKGTTYSGDACISINSCRADLPACPNLSEFAVSRFTFAV